MNNNIPMKYIEILKFKNSIKQKKSALSDSVFVLLYCNKNVRCDMGEEGKQ